MSDLISRQDVIDAFWKLKVEIRPSAIYAIDEMFRQLPSANPWISCSERLPRQGQKVICQCRANIIKVLKLEADGDWYQDADHCYMSGFVVAWMPLPEPWEGDQS